MYTWQTQQSPVPFFFLKYLVLKVVGEQPFLIDALFPIAYLVNKHILHERTHLRCLFSST